ncbi:MAG: phosphatidylinositol mannoside acyltransferase [Acidimicrobiales bacterium]
MVARPDITTGYRAASIVARRLPRPAARLGMRYGGVFASLFAGDRRVIVERNLRRARGADIPDADLNRSVARTFEAYVRYYIDSLRLPDLDDVEIDEGFDYVGFDHIQRARANGKAPILVLPHLGGWEWAAFWLARIHDIKVTAVVEPLEPPELFDWFADFRESLGMDIVPVGPEAGPAILDAVEKRNTICLLADRIVAGASAVPVEFFGETTMLPAGPATIALRTGSPLLPTAVYFRGSQHFAEVRPPVAAERQGRFRDDVTRVTQDLARELERFIRAAPEQWHVLQPGWPSDYRALGRPLPDHLKAI